MQLLSKPSLRSIWLQVVHIYHTNPIYRGMLSYAIIWPTSNLINQTVMGREHYDFREALRFCLFGSLYIAPTLYMWIRFASKLWPHSNFKTSFLKAMVEQFTYSPFAMTSFFFGMSLLEGKSISDAVLEVRTKFANTFLTAICIWPILQTINFTFISERNRVPYVSICSLGWTCYLAYMKHLDNAKLAQLQAESALPLLPFNIPEEVLEDPPAVKKDDIEKSYVSNCLNTVDLSPYNKLVNLTLKS